MNPAPDGKTGKASQKRIFQGPACRGAPRPNGWPASTKHVINIPNLEQGSKPGDSGTVWHCRDCRLRGLHDFMSDRQRTVSPRAPPICRTRHRATSGGRGGFGRNAAGPLIQTSVLSLKYGRRRLGWLKVSREFISFKSACILPISATRNHFLCNRRSRQCWCSVPPLARQTALGNTFLYKSRTTPLVWSHRDCFSSLSYGVYSKLPETFSPIPSRRRYKSLQVRSTPSNCSACQSADLGRNVSSFTRS